jgi:tetratricopeptide (TPR) repeat protein
MKIQPFALPGLSTQCRENLFAATANGKRWSRIVYPATWATEHKLKKIGIGSEARVALVIFAGCVETLANAATLMIKPLATRMWVARHSIRCEWCITSGVVSYEEKQYDKALKCFTTAAALNQKDKASSSVFSEKNLSRQEEIHYWLGKCHRRKKNFAQAIDCFQNVKALHLDSFLNKKIEHKLLKLELLSGEPLFIASAEERDRLSSWEIIASRTYCEKVFNCDERGTVLKEMERIYNEPAIKPIFDLVANRARKQPDKFNFLILTPETMKKYYGGKGKVRGFYNLKESLSMIMEQGSGFTKKNLAVMVHECTHMALKSVFHENCGIFRDLSCAPFHCKDKNRKAEFEEVEISTLNTIFKVLESLRSNKSIDFDRINKSPNTHFKSKRDLVESIAKYAKELFRKGTFEREFEDETTTIKKILEAYNIFSTSLDPRYADSSVPEELIARVTQLIVEIRSVSAFDCIAPLKLYYDQNVHPILIRAAS